MRSLALFTAAVFTTVANAQKDGTYADAEAKKAQKFTEETDKINYAVEKQTRYAADDADIYDNFDVSATWKLQDEDYVSWAGTEPTKIFKMLSGTPFWLENRTKIWDDATKDLGKLEVVCPKGRECRHAEREVLGTRLVQDWQGLIDSFRDQIAAEISDTKHEIKKSYKVFEQCAKDDDCCPTNDVTIENWYIQITDYKEKMNALLLERVVTMNKIEEIKQECPDVVSAYIGVQPVDRVDLDDDLNIVVTDGAIIGGGAVAGGSSSQTETQTSSETTSSSQCVNSRWITTDCNGDDCKDFDEGDQAAQENCMKGGITWQPDQASGAVTQSSTSSSTTTSSTTSQKCVDGFYIETTCVGELCQPPVQGGPC